MKPEVAGDEKTVSSFVGSICRVPVGEAKLAVPASPWVPYATLNRLIEAINVDVIGLSECFIGVGHSMDLRATDTASFHYIRAGRGNVYIDDAPSISVGSDTLIVVPPQNTFKFAPATSIEACDVAHEQRGDAAAVLMICGKFKASYSASVDLFDTLTDPIIERFSPSESLEPKLIMALSEWVSQKACADAIVSSTIKQVIIALVRRSFVSLNGWTRRFATLAGYETVTASAMTQDDPGNGAAKIES